MDKSNKLVNTLSKRNTQIHSVNCVNDLATTYLTYGINQKPKKVQIKDYITSIYTQRQY